MLSVDHAEAFKYNPICQFLELFLVQFELNNGLELNKLGAGVFANMENCSVLGTREL